MATQSSSKNYLCMAVEALPCLLSFVTTFTWVFFTTAPSNSVNATWFWLTAIAIPTIFSSIYLIYHSHHSSTNRLSWYKISNLQRATLDVIRSVAGAAAVALITVDVDWIILTLVGSDLEPLGSSKDSKFNDVANEWAKVIFAGILVILCTACLFALVGQALSADFGVLQTALLDAKSERENLEARERLREEETGMVESEQEERK